MTGHKQKEWTKVYRIKGECGGINVYIAGEFVVRALMEAKINPACPNLLMKIEEVYALPRKKIGFIIIQLKESDIEEV